ncbi:50S ribosomal protein L6 [candidate division WOR-1 bacterium RIFOXYA12_FULL_43_27]|uniref:Large ribosomal subunit protein uL6 n=1 Tax=candidate division WOR-1 bacterium RIFOXYC2_FULL_46_14 TaxID=1802587 RepID=A0A1F4U5W8_UNCSA|nr:MAG: 50S ribosomal protein L6 [candidate division WOR-1 bacterium RIFOXYA12_FULL_43_27]OGC20432.1 MAG: 50S ribosomal protein L6 [candidate division WOR-1 bacterium RIFOXYB2_FULL_46_45]OGC31831.1 MAG: 50S ribosomal protein L6 [candidate division WOR-1 bacterium RIFOXYA2_FULL_46_56]OGC40277.1 MAG: 50S ribosomal protein L6 [candidate division WOR-1 bacterium RIFOXYC2_FULL_46_14]
MSRIGRQPIEVPAGVKVKIDGNKVTVTGAKGTLERVIDDPNIKVELKEKTLFVVRTKESAPVRAKHGLYRALLKGMITGVAVEFKKVLLLSGVGYRAQVDGKKLVMQLGYSHPIEFVPPAGISFSIEGQNKISVSGIDKQLVGQVAQNVRYSRPVEPYKAKGVSYDGEHVRRKAGKAAKSAGGAK